MDVVAEENQEECLGIQDQASAEVQVSMEAEVSHCNLLEKRRAGLVTKLKIDFYFRKVEKLKNGEEFLHVMYF